MDNYPPGAANDPRAPYNQPVDPAIEVTVRTTLVKETVIMADSSCVFPEYDDDLGDYFRSQDKTAAEIITDCGRIVKELIRENRRRYADIYLPRLLDACDGWEEETLTVNM